MIFVLLPPNRRIMALVNEHLLKLPENYLFTDIVKRVNSFKVTHPQARIIHLGIGDVTLPIPKACVEAMQKAAGEIRESQHIQRIRT